MESLGKIGLVIYIFGVCWVLFAFLKGYKKKLAVAVIVIGAALTLYGFTNMPQVEEIIDTKTSDTIEVPEIQDSGSKTDISIEKDVTELSGN